MNNTSEAISLIDRFEDGEAVKMKTYVKDLLKSRLFLGHYLERRLVTLPKRSLEQCDALYRDVVVLSAAEVELKRDLIEVQNRLCCVYLNSHWIGITEGTPIGYKNAICLWTEIDNQPFGPYWFQIRSVKFLDAEIIVQLKCIRHISDAYIELEPVLSGSSKKPLANIAKVVTQPAANSEALNETYNEFKDLLKSAVSISSVKEFVKFITLVVIAVFTGSTAFINFLGNFVLALMRELSVLMKNSTPMFLGFLDFISKLVGGFYILVAMIFRPSPGPVPPSRNVYQNARYQRPSIGYGQDYDSKEFD